MMMAWAIAVLLWVLVVLGVAGMNGWRVRVHRGWMPGLKDRRIMQQERHKMMAERGRNGQD